MVAKGKAKGRGISSAHARAGRAIAAVLFVVILAAVAAASAVSVARASGPAVCNPETGAGCTNPCTGKYHAMVIDVVSPTANATSFSVTWYVGPSQLSGSLEWGNSSNPQAFIASVGSGGGPFYEYFNYLEPSTTYSYVIYATPTAAEEEYPNCYEGGSDPSSFTTAIWPTETQLGVSVWVNGTVTNVAKQEAPANVLVKLQCPSKNGIVENMLTSTNSVGVYSFEVDTNGLIPAWCILDDTPFTVSVLNGAVADGNSYTMWTGNWNETAVLFAPEDLNFVLPTNYQSNYAVEYLDFSNAPAGYSNLAISSGGGYTDSYSYSTSVSGTVGAIGAGISSTSSSSEGLTVGGGVASTNGTLCYASTPMVTGTVAFSAISRSWSYVQSLYDDSLNGRFCNADLGNGVIALTTPSDWMTPENASADGLYILSYQGTPLEDYPVPPGKSVTYTETISTSTSFSTTVTASFSVSGTLAGAIPLSAQFSASWSQTVSTSSSVNLQATIGPPDTAVGDSCYDVFGEGGSAASNTADMVGIYWWPEPSGGCG